MQIEIDLYSVVSTKCKGTHFAYGVKIYSSELSVRMSQFTYVWKEYTQINTRVSKSLYVYTALGTINQVPEFISFTAR